jgi:hypothetical protein
VSLASNSQATNINEKDGRARIGYLAVKNFLGDSPDRMVAKYPWSTLFLFPKDPNEFLAFCRQPCLNGTIHLFIPGFDYGIVPLYEAFCEPE